MSNAFSEEADTQLSSFIRTFHEKIEIPTEISKKTAFLSKKSTKSSRKALSMKNTIYDDNSASNKIDIQAAQMEVQLRLKEQEVERLQAEVRSLVKIQNDQVIALQMALQDRKELEKQIEQMTQKPGITSPPREDESRPGTATLKTPKNAPSRKEKTPETVKNRLFLRALLLNDQGLITQLSKEVHLIKDAHMRGLAAQGLFDQMKTYMKLNQVFERVFGDVDNDTFSRTFEESFKSLIDARRIILWTRIHSAGVLVSDTLQQLIPEGEGIVGKVANTKEQLIVTDPIRDESYSETYERIILSSARISLYQPVVNDDNEVVWIIQVIDRLSSKGVVKSPNQSDLLIIDTVSNELKALWRRLDQTDKKKRYILTESTKTLIAERQVMPLLESVKSTGLDLVQCESLDVLFTDSTKNCLYALREQGTAAVNVNMVVRMEYPIEEAGIAGSAFSARSPISCPVARHHKGYKEKIDGMYGDGSILAVPLVSKKGSVLLVVVARHKKQLDLFTSGDELVLEALAKLAQRALTSAQNHERNLAEIQKAMANHKHYSALLSIATELSSELDTDALISKILTKAQIFVGADRGSLFLVDKELGGLWSMVARGTSQKIFVPKGHGIAGYVAETGETIVIADAYEDARFDPSSDKATGYRTKSVLCVPINNTAGEIIGCTQMINKLGQSEFNSMDVELMNAFNVFCGIALSNAALYKTATKGQSKMSTTLDIAMELTKAEDLGVYINSVIEKMLPLLEAEHLLMFICDKNHKKLNLFSHLDLESAAKVIPIDSEAVGYVAMTGSELSIEDASIESRFHFQWFSQAHIDVKQLIAVPSFDSSGQVVGVVLAVNKVKVQFNEDDKSLIRAIASFTGLAIERHFDFSKQSYPDIVRQIEGGSPLSISDKKFELLDSMFFRAWKLSKFGQIKIIYASFIKCFLSENLAVSPLRLFNFIVSVSNMHKAIPFQRWSDVVDTVQFAYLLVSTEDTKNVFTEIELLALGVTLLCHISGSLKKKAPQAVYPLTLLYNDIPYEQVINIRSVSSALRSNDCNILINMASEDQHEFWKLLSILMTAADPSMKDSLLEECSSVASIDLGKREDRVLLLRLLIQTSTHQRAIRPFSNNLPWSTYICKEASSFGSAADIATKQIGYMKQVIVPLLKALSLYLPQAQELKNQLHVNVEVWEGFIAQAHAQKSMNKTV